MDENTEKLLNELINNDKKRESSQKVFWRIVAIFGGLIILSSFYAGVSFNRMSTTIESLDAITIENSKAIDMQVGVTNSVVIDAIDNIHPEYEIRSKELQKLSIYHAHQIRGAAQ